jgi:DNA-binding GntR family transcriptional regulator
MDISSTAMIVQSLSRAIVEHRLQPGAKLAEQKLADHFGVSRTLVRQAFFQLSQNRLVRMEPSRGAFVAAPSVEEAKQVFAVRRMLEIELTKQFTQTATPAKIKALRAHLAKEHEALHDQDAAGRTELLGDFHVRMAELTGNDVLAEILGDLISRCSLIALMYQTARDAKCSSEEHDRLVEAIELKNETEAVRLMTEHLDNVEKSLTFNKRQPSADISEALR